MLISIAKIQDKIKILQLFKYCRRIVENMQNNKSREQNDHCDEAASSNNNASSIPMWRNLSLQNEESIRNLLGAFNAVQSYQTPRPTNSVPVSYARSRSDPYCSYNSRVPSGTGQSAESLGLKNAPLRQWQHTALGRKLKEHDNYGKQNGVVFKLMSYNVLSQKLLDDHPELYKTHRRNNLNWEQRWKRLKSEMTYHKADIICLQEVQESQLDSYVNFFKAMGYEGVYKKRTGDEYPDGCAIFFNTYKFVMVEHHTVEYFQPTSTLLNRNNVAIIAKFAPKDARDKCFIVATTHLLYNPKREDVRVAQTQVLLTEIDRFAYDQTSRKGYLPILLCGDFNSQPADGVFKLITQQQVKYNNYMNSNSVKGWLPPDIGVTNNCKHLRLEFQRNNHDGVLTRSEEDAIIQLHHSQRTVTVDNRDASDFKDNKDYLTNVFQSGSLIHNIDFKSVYSHGSGATTHQNEWVVVDYMFFSTSDDKTALKFLQRYELPAIQTLQNNQISIPDERCGSDHFTLIAKFKFEY